MEKCRALKAAMLFVRAKLLKHACSARSLQPSAPCLPAGHFPGRTPIFCPIQPERACWVNRLSLPGEPVFLDCNLPGTLSEQLATGLTPLCQKNRTCALPEKKRKQTCHGNVQHRAAGRSQKNCKFPLIIFRLSVDVVVLYALSPGRADPAQSVFFPAGKKWMAATA